MLYSRKWILYSIFKIRESMNSYTGTEQIFYIMYASKNKLSVYWRDAGATVIARWRQFLTN